MHEAALRLAMELGLEHVTVEAIADAANVSRRTFSNYFSGKEEALLYVDKQRIRELVSSLRARPAEETPWLALTNSAEELVRNAGERDPAWVAEATLVRRHPSLAAYQVATYAEMERELAAAIADRMPAQSRSPLRPRLLAATFLVSVRIATRAWLDDPGGPPLTALVRQALEETGSRFT